MKARYVKKPVWPWPPEWSDEMKVAAAYVTECRHRTTEGLFLLPLEYAAADLGWTARKFDKTLIKLQAAGVLMYDRQAKVCLLMGALTVQSPQNPNQTEAAIRKVADLPPTPLFRQFLALAREHAPERLGQPLEQRLPERFREPLIRPLSKPLDERSVERFDQPHTHTSTIDAHAS